MAVFSSRSDRVTKTSSKKIGGSAEISFQTGAHCLIGGKHHKPLLGHLQALKSRVWIRRFSLEIFLEAISKISGHGRFLHNLKISGYHFPSPEIKKSVKVWKIIQETL